MEPTPHVRVEDGCVQVDGWRTCQPEIARFLELREASGRSPETALEQALRVGVLALEAAGTSVDVQRLDREFERFTATLDERFAQRVAQLEGALSDAFGEGDGALDRALERFLGDGGELASLFDPERRDSALGRMRALLGAHLDGEGSTLHRLLDLRNDDSPLATWRTELQREFERQRRLIEDYRRELAEQAAAQVAAAEERAKAEVAAVRAELDATEALSAEHERGTAKGREFEASVFDAVDQLARVFGDVAEPTGDVQGLGACKKGDVVVTLNPRETGGVELRVVIEAKDKPLGLTPLLRELDAARDNRGAVAAVAVFARDEQMPAGAAPFRELGQGRYAVLLDKEAIDDRLALEVGFRLARYQALAELSVDTDEVDTRGVREDVEAARHKLQAFATLKGNLTRLRNTLDGGIDDLGRQLDELRAGLLEVLDRLESRVRVVGDEPDERASGLSVA